MEILSAASTTYYVQFGEARVGFKENEFNGITPISYHKDLPENTSWSGTLTGLMKGYSEDARKIEGRYPNGVHGVVDLDFSDLGLTHLPPWILLQAKQARTLDISGNNIHWLPIQLKELHLTKLDISGNTRLQPNFESFSEWLLDMPGLQIVANDMGFNFIPGGAWNKRFSSNQLPFGYQYCQTQLPYSSQEDLF